jgi:branched-chain amino acid transport system ATP-binding protein
VSEALLEVDDVVAGYGATQVLHGLSLQVRTGTITALLGANGAGKTTLMRTLAGLLPLSSGELRFERAAFTHREAHERVESGLVLVPEGRWVFPSLTVEDNLRLGGITPRARSSWKQTLEQVYALFPVLPQRRKQAAGTLSGGEQQMLAIGRGLMSRPRLMLLDEPSLGLAPVMAAQIFDLMRSLVATGLTLMLAEQDVNRTLAVADYAYVIENGRVATEGDARGLAEDPLIKQAYLGL